MPPSRTWMFVPALLSLCGCALRGNVDALESRLRVQEDSLAEMRSQLAGARSEAAVARREADALRTQLAQRGEPALLPEQAQALYRVEKLAIADMLTGALDNDGRPGDDELNVLLIPQDEQGEPVKLPGNVRFELSDLGRDGAARRLGVWEFTAEQTRELWQGGFFGSGYQFRFPWQETPTSKSLLLHARLTTADGRQFDASQEIAVNLPPAAGVIEQAGGTRPVRRTAAASPSSAASFGAPPPAAGSRFRPPAGRAPSPLFDPAERLPPPTREGADEPVLSPPPWRFAPPERTETSDSRRDWELPVLR